MGWNSGLDIADKVWSIIKEYIPEEKKPEVAEDLISLFEGYGCDSMMETALWDFAMKSCSCFDQNHEPDNNCKKCRGHGYVKYNYI